MPVDEFRRQIEVILVGNFLMTQNVAQSMINHGRKGCIICITSTEAHQGRPTSIGYATGKSGLLNFARGCAATLAKYGIRVNTLTPTATDASDGIDRAERWGVKRVRVTAQGNFEDMVMPTGGGGLHYRLKDTPLQKLPNPRHYAKAAIFLASDDGEMITGFDLRVDAGNIAKYWGWHPDDPNSN
jgi:NAD(P)-dependent dehydrogenase (short-subunit alcohol dehydrogenase family)